jgi:hypothetical protein
LRDSYHDAETPCRSSFIQTTTMVRLKTSCCAIMSLHSARVIVAPSLLITLADLPAKAPFHEAANELSIPPKGSDLGKCASLGDRKIDSLSSFYFSCRIDFAPSRHLNVGIKQVHHMLICTSKNSCEIVAFAPP